MLIDWAKIERLKKGATPAEAKGVNTFSKDIEFSKVGGRLAELKSEEKPGPKRLMLAEDYDVGSDVFADVVVADTYTRSPSLEISTLTGPVELSISLTSVQVRHLYNYIQEHFIIEEDI